MLYVKNAEDCSDLSRKDAQVNIEYSGVEGRF